MVLAASSAEIGAQAPDTGGSPPNGEIASEQAALPNSRLETEIELDALLARERHEAAVPLAERLVELTEAEFGVDSVEAARAHQKLGHVRTLVGAYDLAEQAFLHAVDVVRRVDSPYTALAIDPLLGLGDSYQSAGHHINAIAAYSEARTVSRRVYGLLNAGQAEILDRMTESYQQLDQYADADAQQLQILYLAERRSEEGSPGHLDAIYHYAGWLRATRRFNDERLQYHRAIQLISDKHGDDHPLMARPLREIGNSFRDQRLPHGDGLSSLQSALEILEQSGDALPLEKAQVLRDIGDWQIAFARIEPELSFYVRAWELLGLVEGGERLREDWFGRLNNVYSEPINQRGLTASSTATAGHVIVVFGLDRYGRTTDVRVLQSEPPGFKDDAVVRAVRRWRYRPPMENGEIVARDDFPLKVNFRYDPAVLAQFGLGGPAESPSADDGARPEDAASER